MRLPLPFVWPAAVPFWVVYVWAFVPEGLLLRRAGRSPAARGAQDAGSLRVLVLGTWVALTAAFVLAFRAPAAAMSDASRMPAYVAGIALLVAGSLLRRHCFRMLGAHFTGAVQVTADQPVVERGAYRWVRHPSYSAGVLMFAGIGLALGNWASAAVLVAATIALYAYRVAVEERALGATLGERYAAYRSRTRYRFIPFVL
jgi:protein-S-isoprenylcysteine O-methyltransferase Ste14